MLPDSSNSSPNEYPGTLGRLIGQHTAAVQLAAEQAAAEMTRDSVRTFDAFYFTIHRNK